MLLLCYQVFSYWLAVNTGGKIFLHSISRLCGDDDDGVLWSRGNVQKQISKHYFFYHGSEILSAYFPGDLVT